MQKIYFSEPGVVFDNGSGKNKLWETVTTGDNSGIKIIDIGFEDKFCTARIDDAILKPSDGRYNDHSVRIEKNAVDQIEEIVKKAVEKYGKSRVGCCVGSCDNGCEYSLGFHTKIKSGIIPEDFELEKICPDYHSTYIRERFGLEGPCLTFSTACSSSALAIIKGGELIRAGIVDAMVVGGIDTANNIALMGFHSLEAISGEPVLPFSKNRKGINIGEAGAFFLISKDDISENGIVLSGWGESADAYHMTSPDPEGEGAIRSMKKSLDLAELKPTDISYINLHGTGTAFNDSMEGKAVDALFGEYKVPCSSTKGMTGHTLGAAGALEAAICWLTIKNNEGKKDKVFPCHVWDDVRDEEIPEINLVQKGSIISTEKEVRYCMSNSFAFGGSNATIILGKE